MSDYGVKYWYAEDLTHKFSETISKPLQRLLDNEVKKAVKDYVRDGLFCVLYGNGTDLKVVFSPAEVLDHIEHTESLIAMLENELETHLPMEFYSKALDYVPDADDEDGPRTKLLQAMIRAYYDNGGKKAKKRGK